MPTKQKKVMPKRRNRLGTRNDPPTPPLRFETVQDAKKHIKANKAKLIEHVTHSRGMRINIVYPDGKARTLSIEKPKPKD